MNTKYDDALSQNPGRIIVVRCNTCGVDYDVRFVSNEVQHKGANHVMSFDCPKGAPLRKHGEFGRLPPRLGSNRRQSRGAK